MKKKTIRKHCLKIIQNKEHPLYLFSMTGEELQQVATVSRVNRNSEGEVIGYQRPEVKSHVKEILAYIENENAIFPNAIILAMDSSVKFTTTEKLTNKTGSVPGILEFSIDHTVEDKIAWIVDGQQRAFALWNSSRKAFPVPITAFIAESVETQRDQFLRVNNTRPLPKGLINELLPEVLSPITQELSKKKYPSILCDMLNRDHDSPFFSLIRRPSTPKEERKKAVITDTSVILMIEESMTNPSGCLFTCHSIGTGEIDIQAMMMILKTFWKAVKEVFNTAWGKPPTESRLMHGVGIRAMGKLMDKIMPSIDCRLSDAEKLAITELNYISGFCRWADGNWRDLGNIAWNEIQNTSRHVHCISDYLVRTYLFERTHY
ncbi:MAG: DGQHR domain-containing protein DpdB [Candidatus Xenobiia bacterium LiM19]